MSFDVDSGSRARAWPDRPQRAKSQVHRRPPDPRRLRGRDRHAPALHDAARPTAAAPSRPPRSCCRRSASRSGRFRGAGPALAGRRRRPATSPTTPTCRATITIAPAIGEAGKTTVYVRKRNPTIDTGRARRVQRVHRDLDALHAPRLPGPLRRGRAALHLPLPRRRLRLRRQGRRRPAGAPARPLLHARQRRAAWRSARATRVNSELERFSPRDPGEPLDGIGQYLYPSRPTIRKIGPGGPMPKLPLPPLPSRAPAAAQAPRRDVRAGQTPVEHGAEAGDRAVDWIDERTSLSGAGRWVMFRKVPKGTNWFYTLGSATMFAFLSPGGHRRVPGDVLRPVADARLRVDRATSTTRSSSASSCTACTSGARR